MSRPSPSGTFGNPKRFIAIVGTTLASLLSTGTCSAAPNLIANGSFESNSGFVERADFPRVADLSGSAPTGWTRDSIDLAEYFVSSPPYLGATIYNPADGSYFIGAHDGEWWEQTFATVSGTEYTLTYSSAYGAGWWATASSYYRPGSVPGTVTLTGNRLLLATGLAGSSLPPTGNTLLNSPFVWSQHTATFVADSSSTTLRFAGSTVPNGGFLFVDNVTVSAVPELSTESLFIIGLMGLVSVAKRRGSLRSTHS